jgi:hypothetical protein
VTVDEKQRPVLVVEACEGAATKVNLFLDREGLTDDEENEQVTARISDVPMSGTSELVLHAPAGPRAGQSVEVIVDRGYMATAVGEGTLRCSVRWLPGRGSRRYGAWDGQHQRLRIRNRGRRSRDARNWR